MFFYRQRINPRNVKLLKSHSHPLPRTHVPRPGLGSLPAHRELCDPGASYLVGNCLFYSLTKFLKADFHFSLWVQMFFLTWFMGSLTIPYFQEFSKSGFPLYLVKCVYLERLSNQCHF